jgi:hypothetical protein
MRRNGEDEGRDSSYAQVAHYSWEMKNALQIYFNQHVLGTYLLSHC